MSDLPTREEAAMVRMMLSQEHPDMPAEFLRKKLRGLIDAYADGRLVDREGIDYEAVKALPGREWYIDADTYIHAILDAAYGIGGDDE